MSIKRIVAAGFVAVAALAAIAGEVKATAVTAQQRYPWNGLVDITVTIEGAAEDVAQADCLFVATNSAIKAALPVLHITPNGAEIGSGTTWTRKYIWDTNADVGEVKIDDIVLAVDVTIGVQLWKDGPCWAQCNVGATKPEECGYHFWWGDTVGYKRNAADDGWVSVKDGSSFSFGEENCPTYGKDNSQLQSDGYIDLTGNLVAAHDAATAHLGSPWRMPTDAEFAAMINNCDTEWITINGVSGQLIKGRGAYASKSIFFPAVGYGDDSGLYFLGSLGGCRSSTPDSGYSYGVWNAFFRSWDFYRDFYSRRDLGQAVRPVRGFAQATVSTGGIPTHFSLDGRKGDRPSAGTETLTFSNLWNGDADATVTIAQDGAAIFTGLKGEGTKTWAVDRNGRYVLTHTTYVNGVAGKVETAAFVVTGKDVPVGELTIDWGQSSFVYDGQPKTPVVTVKDGATALTKGTHYLVEYKDNVNVGTAKAIVKGINQYVGEVTNEFTITAATIGPGVGEEPGSGVIPEDGLSKFDATYVYDGEGHAINTQALYAVTLVGSTPSFSFSLDGETSWQNEPFVYTNVGEYVMWYKIAAPNYADYKHQAKVTIQPLELTVTFDANGGSCPMASKTVTHGETYGTFPTPTWTGHIFAGWYTAAKDGDEVKESTGVSIMAPQTLYAHWVSVKSVSAKQRYPWNGLVDIVVAFEGESNDVAKVDCSFIATNSATKAELSVATITRKGADSGKDNAWSRRFIWDAGADVGAVKIDVVVLAVVARISVEGGVQLWENGPYWATCNVGATKPEEYGYYFRWGDTVGHKRNAADNGWVSVKDGSSFSFKYGNSPTFDKDNSQLQSMGYIDSTGNLVAAHDAATAHLGLPWRMPTNAEFSALINNCVMEWTSRNGVSGLLVKGLGAYASKSIFLPAAGRGDDSHLVNFGTNGYYWSSTPTSPFTAENLSFCSKNSVRYGINRDHGHSVRPVRGYAQATVSADGVSTHFSLDGRTGDRASSGTETLTFSNLWDGDAEAAVTIAQDGAAIFEGLAGEGVKAWTVDRNGRYVLTHTTYVNGVAGKVETAVFVVEGLSPEAEKLRESFDGLGEVTPDGDGWKVTITNDVGGTVELGDNLGPVTLDLKGRNLIGAAGTTGDAVSVPGGDGAPAIRIAATGKDGNPTVLTIVDSVPDNTDDVIGGRGGDGTPGGNGGAAIEVVGEAKVGVKVNVGVSVGIRGGAGGTDLNGSTHGGNGGSGVNGDVGTNDGSISGGDGGDSEHGRFGDGGKGVTGSVDENNGTINDADERLVVVKTVGRYLALDLVDDLGIEIPSDVDYAAGDKVTVKVEGLAKGLKVVTTLALVYADPSTKENVIKNCITVEGVPTETVDFETRPMFARVTTTYKNKTKTADGTGKTESLQPVGLSIVPQEPCVLTPGGLNEVYAPADIAKLWLEVADAKTNPKEWSFKGWPAGIKYNDKATDVSWNCKNGMATVKATAAPYTVYGQPTKAGEFPIIATHKYKVGKTTVSETFSAVLTVWGDDGVTDFRYTDQAYVATETKTLGATFKGFSGLPAGIKWTAKPVTVKNKDKSVTTNVVAYSLYGTPTKAGVFAVTATKVDPDDPNGKKTVKETFLWKVEPGENDGFLGTMNWPVADGAVTVMAGVVQTNWTCSLPADAKVTASGLPAGLKLAQDKTTKAWTLAGTPTKAGNFVVTLKTVRNGVTVNERISIIVTANEWTGNWYGVQSGDDADASLLAEVTVAENGTVKLVYTEASTNYNAKGAVQSAVRKTTVTVKNLDADGTTATLTLTKDKKDPLSQDRTCVLDFGNGELRVDGTATMRLLETDADALWPEVLTVVLEETAGGETNAYGYVTATYNAKKGSFALAGKLWDGTAVKGTCSALADGVISPVLVTDKAKNAVSITLGSADGDLCVFVRENGELVPVGRKLPNGCEPWSGSFAAADLKSKKFNTMSGATQLVVLTGRDGEGAVATRVLDVPEKDRKASVSAQGLVKFTATDAGGWKWVCELLPVRRDGVGAVATQGDDLQFRGIATGTKKGEPTQVCPVWAE